MLSFVFLDSDKLDSPSLREMPLADLPDAPSWGTELELLLRDARLFVLGASWSWNSFPDGDVLLWSWSEPLD